MLNDDDFDHALENDNIEEENEVREPRNRKAPSWTKDYDMSMLAMDEALKGENAYEWSTAIKMR